MIYYVFRDEEFKDFLTDTPFWRGAATIKKGRKKALKYLSYIQCQPAPAEMENGGFSILLNHQFFIHVGART